MLHKNYVNPKKFEVFLRKTPFGAFCFIINSILTQLVLNVGHIEATRVDYPKLSESANVSFPKWGGVCDAGKLQSPINLERRAPYVRLYEGWDPLFFEGHERKQKHILISLDKKRVKLSNFYTPILLRGGHLLFNHVVESIYFHWPAEHVLEGKRHLLECQILCRNNYYPNLTNALSHVDGVVMLSVLFKKSQNFNEGISNILQYVEKLSEFGSTSTSLNMSVFQLSSLVPAIGEYFVYKGSLTSPPCTEIITWLVLGQPFSMSQYQLQKFQAIQYDIGKKISNNYRFNQVRNNRRVLYVPNVKLFSSGSERGAELYAQFIIILCFVLRFGVN